LLVRLENLFQLFGILDLLKGSDLILKGIGLAQQKNMARNALEYFSQVDTASLLE
jgi:hypothetical protein